MKKISILLISLILVAGSAYARKGTIMLIGYINPEFKGKTVNKILIRAMNAEFYFIDQIERRMKTELEDESDGGVKVIQYQQLFPPVKEYSPDEIEKVLNEQNIDGVLVFTIGAAEEKITTGWSFAFLPFFRRGSYTEAKRYTNTKIDLYDVNTKKVMWTAQGNFIVEGGSKRSYKITSRYMAIKTTSLLLKKGLLAKPKLAEKSGQ